MTLGSKLLCIQAPGLWAKGLHASPTTVRGATQGEPGGKPNLMPLQESSGLSGRPPGTDCWAHGGVGPTQHGEPHVGQLTTILGTGQLGHPLDESFEYASLWFAEFFSLVNSLFDF